MICLAKYLGIFQALKIKAVVFSPTSGINDPSPIWCTGLPQAIHQSRHVAVVNCV
jgi:hypothetical protein